MKAFLTKHQFIAFSFLTILISVSFWFVAKEQSGVLKMLFTQFGYFAPALVAIILTIIIKLELTSYSTKTQLSR